MKIGKKKLIATMLLMLLFSVLCGNSAKADVHSINPYGEPTMIRTTCYTWTGQWGFMRNCKGDTRQQYPLHNLFSAICQPVHLLEQ